jgi:hypothetical protein
MHPTNTTPRRSPRYLRYRVQTRHSGMNIMAMSQFCSLAAARRCQRDELRDGWPSHIYDMRTGERINRSA